MENLKRPLRPWRLFTHHCHVHREIMSPNITSTFSNGDFTTCLSNQFPSLTNLSENTSVLLSSLNFPRCNIRKHPLILLLVTWEKRPTPPGYNISWVVVETNKVSLSFLFSRLNHPITQILIPKPVALHGVLNYFDRVLTITRGQLNRSFFVSFVSGLEVDFLWFCKKILGMKLYKIITYTPRVGFIPKFKV